MAATRYVVVANPGTPRCAASLAALAASGIEAAVVPWHDVIATRGDLGSLRAFDRPAVVRLESPGKSADACRLMLAAGAEGDPAEEAYCWQAVDLPKGLLCRPGLWYRGFARVLAGLRRSYNVRPHLRPTACPLAIAAMFDKTATADRLRAAGVPVPDWLENPADAFVQVGPDRDGRWPTAYLKLRYGSSASGIISLRCGEAFTGVTTLAEIDGRFFNSRAMRTASGPALRRAAAFLVAEGAFAQQGVRMARLDGENFDLRVVCLYGTPVAAIFRLSRHPMTNLHLGGRRGDFARCRAAIPHRAWADAMEHAEAAAGLFDSAVAGVDLVFEAGYRDCYVLEVNAFGDHFPGWVDATGRSLHALEIEATGRLRPAAP